MFYYSATLNVWGKQESLVLCHTLVHSFLDSVSKRNSRGKLSHLSVISELSTILAFSISTLKTDRGFQPVLILDVISE